MYELELVNPETAVQLYLDERRSGVSQATLYSHSPRLGHFVRWCEQEGLDNLNDLTGRHIQRFRVWRRDDGGLNNVTLQTQLATFRVFFKWAEII